MRESDNNQYAQLMQLILKINFFVYDHKIVVLQLLENIVRYAPYFVKDPNFIA
jgi:hypothetical protein